MKRKISEFTLGQVNFSVWLGLKMVGAGSACPKKNRTQRRKGAFLIEQRAQRVPWEPYALPSLQFIPLRLCVSAFDFFIRFVC